jgi:hypothetical protein
VTRLSATQFFGETLVQRQLPHLFLSDNVYGKGISLATQENGRDLAEVSALRRPAVEHRVETRNP